MYSRIIPMFVVSKLAYHFLLPPGILLVLVLVAFILRGLGRNRGFWILLVVSFGLLYSFSIEPVHDFFLRPLENEFAPLSSTAPQGAEYVVILGGGTIVNSPAEDGRGSPSIVALKRLIYGIRVANRLEVPVILAGGGQFIEGDEYESEAEIEARLIVELGFDEKQIYTENKSRNTWENASYVEELFNPHSIILVTSAFHMPRSVLSFEKHGITVIPAPTDYRISRREYHYRSYLPSVSSLEGVNSALKEYIGLLYYMLRR